jgi:hypothetical protein
LNYLDYRRLTDVFVATRSTKDLMDHVIAEGKRVYRDTRREHTWLIYHDHLVIWWEKESQEYLKSLPCPIEGNPSRTWYDRQIKISGDENNSQVAKRYKNCLPGDSPELMPLDNHLFADLQEGAGKNVALSYHIKDGDADSALKYSFATPRKVYNSLQRTIKAGCPSSHRIVEDIKRVFCNTLQRIINANGTYIEDYSSKRARHGVRAEAAFRAKKRETLPVDNAMMDLFNGMVQRMKDGGGVSFAIDVKQEDEETLATTLERSDGDRDDEDEAEDEGE